MPATTITTTEAHSRDLVELFAEKSILPQVVQKFNDFFATYFTLAGGKYQKGELCCERSHQCREQQLLLGENTIIVANNVRNKGKGLLLLFLSFSMAS